MATRSPEPTRTEAHREAVFISEAAILRDSRLAPRSDPATWRLTPSTLEAVRTLGSNDRLVILVQPPQPVAVAAEEGDAGAAPGPLSAEERSQRVRSLAACVALGGGRLDAALTCPHIEPCACWGDQPGLLWLAATQFGLDVETCYLLAETAEDVRAAVAAGMRPLLVLGDRRIGDLFGDSPLRKDYPCAEDLSAAAGYIAVEDEISAELGEARSPQPPPLSPEAAKSLPSVTCLVALSRLAQGMQAQVSRQRTELRDVLRWLSFLVIGAIGLGLGVAYLLTHLYRQQAFPAIAYYLTLQFIPRPVRGALFILIGLAIIGPALRAWLRSTRARN